MEFKVSEQVRDAIINYLVTRPYREVAGLVPHMMSLTPIAQEPSQEPAAEQPVAPQAKSRAKKQPPSTSVESEGKIDGRLKA